jgi:MoaA/NifB/PqqE/SkfB family radical SAM enzyme
VRYDREADWHLLHTCNYRCSYCFLSDALLGTKIRTFASPKEWRAAFDATGAIWLLHLSGGEPSVYPQIVALCEALTARHFISLNSNLTHPSFAQFAERIDPSRVSFINAGLHLEERDRRKGHAVFLRHAALLRDKGFPLLISLVATPEALARFEQAAALVQPLGLVPIPKLLRGPHAGRVFPNDYSEAERSRFRTFAAQAREAYAPAVARMPARPSIDMFDDDRFLERLPEFAGLACSAGDRFVSIMRTGDVYRCSSKTPLGNVLRRSFAPRSGATPCDTHYCFHFCEKYSRPEHAAAA